jgi:hypothetical protein
LSLISGRYWYPNSSNLRIKSFSFNAKYGNWFDDEKYDEQHQKWRGKPKIIGGNNES